MTYEADDGEGAFPARALGAEAGNGGAIRRVYEAVRAGILDGGYPPGVHLTEEALSAALGVSRTPVRRALRQLEADGFVVNHRHRGAFVSEWTEDKLIEVAEVRAYLGLMAGRLAAPRVGAADIARLRALSAEIAAELAGRRDGYRERVVAANLAFTGLIFARSGNGLLARLFEQTTYVPVVRRTFQHYQDADWQRLLGFHAQMIDALEAADGDCAGSVLKTYFLLAKRGILRAAEAGAAPGENAGGSPKRTHRS